MVLLLQISGGRNEADELHLGCAIHLKAVMIRGTISGERQQGWGTERLWGLAGLVSQELKADTQKPD